MGSWINKMKHFLVIVNSLKDTNLELTKKIISYIEQKGGTGTYFASNGKAMEYAAPDLEDIVDGTECVMVLGGDGTLIRAATRLVKSDLPIIGVNLGTLGYLCELEEASVFPAIDLLMKDEFMLEKRMMLTGYGVKNQNKSAKNVAFNDVVIHRTGALSVVNLIVYVNGEYLNTFHADGIILSTPTGSTGYNLSAGGPIVDPKAQMILMTPINDHNLNSQSIVLEASDEVVIEIGQRRSQKDETVEVSFDGNNALKLEVGDKITVKKAKDAIKICKLSKQSFLVTLRKKMQIYSS